MWFIFGFITLISFSIYFGYKRINASWKGVEIKRNGISYQYKLERHKQKPVRLLVGVSGVAAYDFILKRESRIDRFFKFIGLSVEFQTNNRNFDDLIYIVSDDTGICRQISLSSKVMQAAIDIFHMGEKYGCTARSIRCNSGRLWIEFKVNNDFEEYRISDISSEAVQLIKPLKEELVQSTVTSNRGWRDPFVLKAAIILAISTGLAVNGALHLFRLVWVPIPFTIDSSVLIRDSVYCGLFIVAVLIIANLIFLGRSARAHIVLIELILIGSFGAISTAFAELRDINIELDRSLGTEYELVALDKYKNRSRRSTSYYVYVDDWKSEKKKEKLEVSGSFYRTVSIGDRLMLRQKEGYLRYRWVESLEQVEG